MIGHVAYNFAFIFFFNKSPFKFTAKFMNSHSLMQSLFASKHCKLRQSLTTRFFFSISDRMLMLQYSKHGECILQEIGAAFRGEHQPDLEIICDGSKNTLRAHKLVLAAASPLIRSVSLPSACDFNLIIICFSSYNRTILEDTPCHLNDGLTTIHFPDIHISFFRLLLDFLYSGQTYVPVHELEQLQDLLALLQIKPNIWRSGDSKKDIVNSKSCIKLILALSKSAGVSCQTSFERAHRNRILLCKSTP